MERGEIFLRAKANLARGKVFFARGKVFLACRKVFLALLFRAHIYSMFARKHPYPRANILIRAQTYLFLRAEKPFCARKSRFARGRVYQRAEKCFLAEVFPSAEKYF